ncbi:MAG: Calx-beta domain-containing protein [Ardenticatenaceae bacterium]
MKGRLFAVVSLMLIAALFPFFQPNGSLVSAQAPRSVGTPTPSAADQSESGALDLHEDDSATELVEHRTAYTKVYQRPDGSGYAFSYTRPAHYQTQNGEWGEIDNTLIPDPEEPSVYRNAANDFLVQVSSDMSGMQTLSSGLASTLRLVDGDTSIAFRPIGVESSLGELSGQRITYRDTTSDSNLTYSVEADRLVINYEMTSRSAQEKPIEMEVHLTGGRLLHGKEGLILERPSGEAWRLTAQASADKVESGKVSWELNDLGDNKYKLRLVVDDNWLEPIRPDTLVTINATVTRNTNRDAYGQSCYPTIATGNQRNLYLGYERVYGKCRTRPFLRFDSPSLPTGSIITNARAYLYQYVARASSTYNARACRVWQDWGEYTLTWNNQPGVTDCQGYVGVSTALGWKYWTITTIAQAWQNGTANYGIMLQTSNEYADGGIYWSRDCTTSQCSGQQHPYMWIQYTPDTTPPINPTSVNPGCTASDNVWQNTCNNPNFTWSGASDDASGVKDYYVYWGTNPNGSCSTRTTYAGTNPGVVPSDTTYYLRIATRDNAGNIASCQTKFRLKYDGTAPSNPSSINPGCTATSNVWQNTCNNPNFTWSGASGHASGVKGYYVYWGTSSSGSCSIWRSSASYNPPAVPSDTTYYLRIATKDNAGNTSSCQTEFILKYDGTAPSNPTSIDPGCTATSNVWQNTCNNPNFTWSGASGNASGVAGYDIYWGTSSSGSCSTSRSSAGYDPDAVTSGSTYYLRIATKDNAGNTSTCETKFVLRYDGTAPSNPTSINPNCTATSDVWQNTCNNPNFTWSGASDNASGVAGYYIYWGTSSTGSCSTWTTFAGYNPGSIPSGSTYYLRIATRDYAGNTSSCQTKFILKYDGTAPSSTASPPTYDSGGSISVGWIASDSASGVASTKLYVRKSTGCWADSGLPAQTGTSGSFSYTPPSDGTYYFQSVSTDNAGNQEAVPSGCTGTGDDGTVYDTTDPSSTASSPTYDNEDPIPVSWSASDLTSGVLATILYARKSTGSWRHADLSLGTSGTFEWTPDEGDGTYYFQTMSLDEAGNQETEPTGTTGTGDSQTIYDTIDPESSATCPPYANGGGIPVSWTVSDATSGVASTLLYMRESTSSWVNLGSLPPSGSVNYTPSSDGTYYFQTVSTDQAGNQEAVPSGMTGTGDCETVYDTIAPESSATSPPFVSEDPIPVSWSASDATSGVTSTLLYARILTGSWELADLEPQTGISGTFEYSPEENGTYYFQTVSTDRAGNQEAVPTGTTGTGDTETGYDTDTPSSTATCSAYDNLGTIPVAWTARDTTSGVTSTALYARHSTGSWQLDSSQPGTEGTFFYTPRDGDGTYYFQTVSTNQAGNQEEIPQGDTGTGDCETIYDTIAPESSASSPAYDNGGLIVVNWSASDATSGVEESSLYVRKSTGSWAPASLGAQTGTSGSFEWTPDQGDGTYCFQTVARDRAGNREPIPSGSTGDGDSCTVYEAAGIVVSPTSGLETSEAGGTAVFTVTLTSEPTSTVTIGLYSSDLTEGTVSPSELTFDAKGSQVVTITGIEDFVDDEEISYTIILSPSVSTDPNYNALDGDDVSLTSRDDDTAGITISPTAALTTSEAGDTASFGVTLESQPTSDVAIVLASDNLQEGTLSSNPLTLTFGALNWDQTQTVTVTGVDEAVDDGDIAYTIVSAPASSQDTKYNGRNALNVSLTNIDNDGPALSILDQAVSEGDSGTVTALFTVTLSAPSPQDITVEYATTDDTATAGEDYTSKSGSLSILAGNAHGVIPVTVHGDSLDEENERFLLTLSNPTNATLADSQASGTILDDDEPPTVDFSAASYTVDEDAGSLTISVSLSAMSAKTVSVDYATSDGTASTADGDHTATNGTLTFDPSDLTETFTVPISNDAKDEPNETVIISLSDAKNATIGPNHPATLTIVDDDLPPTVEFSQANYSVQEDAALATITVNLSAVSGKTVSVDYATSDGTADNADYTPISGTLTFNANAQSSHTFTVEISDDQQDEENQTVHLTLSNLANGTLGSNHPATLTIIDNDTAGIVISPTVGLTTTETGGSATFTVVLTSQPTATVTINLASSDSTEGAVSPSTLTFTPDNWYIAQTGGVSGVNDDLDDGDISYTIQTAASSGDPTYDSLDPADLSLANLDEDQAGISVNPTSGLVTSENGQQASFTVVLDSQPTADVTLSLSSSDSSEGQLSAQALLFAPASWHIPQTITVTGVNDDIADGPIAYTIVSAPASSTDSNYDGLNPADLAVTNSDDDQPDIIVNPTSGLETSEEGGQASFSVLLSSQPTADVTIFLTTTNSSEGTLQPTSLTFTSGDWSNSRQVTVIGEDDSVDDGDISYTILLNPAISADSGYNGRDPDDVSVTNLDNDSAGITVLPVSGLRTTEGAQTASFSVRLESQPTHEVQLVLNSDNLSEGRLSQNPMSLTFSPLNWNQPQAITVTGVDDSVDDGDVAYTIVTQAATSNDPNYSARNPADVALVNLDDDAPTISFSTDHQDVTVGEGDSGQVAATFVVMLSASSPQNITVDYTTADGTAQAGSDYISKTGTILIPAGRLSDTISVFVLGDTQDETNESFDLNLSNPTNGTLGEAQAQGHITDDDSPAISLSDVVVPEANGPASFTISLSAASPQAITVAYATSDGSASAPNDYSATSGTLTIPAGSSSGTISVPIHDDTRDETDETFSLNLSNATNATLSDDEATGTISDDDAQPTVDFSAASYTVQEDAGSLTIEVSLSAPSEKSISVEYASNGSAISSDYTAVAGTLSFAAGETSGTFPISIHDDAEDEGDESFTLTLSNAIHATIGPNNPASVTIIDNDETSVNQITISGHQKGMVGHTYPFTATVSPAAATLPITYRWQADDHQPITHTAGMSDSGSFTWSTAGIKTISVSASNGADQVLASHQMTLVTRGDVSCNAVYDGIDVLFAVQYVQGQRDATDDCPLPPSPARALFLPACDVNDNATCDGIDALLILRCVNGYNNALCPAAARAPFATNPPALPQAQSATLHIGAAKEGRDGRFTIPISAKLASQLGATTIDVHYDPALLVPTGCAADPNEQFELAQCNHQLEPGTIRLTGISATGASGDLLLAEITFQPVKHKPLAPLRELLAISSLTFADPTGNPIDVQIDKHARHTIYLPTIQHR